MSVSTMEKLTVIVPGDEADALLRSLMRIKAVSLLSLPKEDIDLE